MAAIPVIAKALATDLASFDVQVTTLLDLIPKDGSTINLQTLFVRLSHDSSTELFFWRVPQLSRA